MQESKWAIMSLLESYQNEAAAAARSLEELRLAERFLTTAVAAAPHIEKGETLRALASEALGRIEEGNYPEAAQLASELCKASIREFFVKLYAAKLEPDECPDSRVVKLAATLLDASGPLADITRSIIAWRRVKKVSEIEKRIISVAKRWKLLAEHLTNLYTAATRLEKLTGIRRTRLLAMAADILGNSENDPIHELEELSKLFSDAASIAYNLSDILSDVSKALQGCKERERLYCRWLGQAVAELVAAREYIEKLSEAPSLYTARETILEAMSHLRAGKDLAEMTTRLATSISKKRPTNLRDAITILEAAYSRHSFTRHEEALLEKLVRDGSIDIVDAEDELIDAAMRLCRRRLVRCTLRL